MSMSIYPACSHICAYISWLGIKYSLEAFNFSIIKFLGRWISMKNFVAFTDWSCNNSPIGDIIVLAIENVSNFQMHNEPRLFQRIF